MLPYTLTAATEYLELYAFSPDRQACIEEITGCVSVSDSAFLEGAAPFYPDVFLINSSIYQLGLPDLIFFLCRS
jgi:hypothetical protein